MHVHSYHKRVIRNLPFGSSRTFIELHYPKIHCPAYGIRNEYHDFIDPFSRLTMRFARMVFDLCRRMSVYDVAHHVGLH